jgi:hypothetical protein
VLHRRPRAHAPATRPRAPAGREIAFTDLFVAHANIDGILAGGYRKSVILSERSEPADIEARILDMLADYRQAPEPAFSLISSNEIWVTVGDRQFGIDMTDYWQSIAIFKRFVTAQDNALYAPTALTGGPRTCPMFRMPIDATQPNCY